MTAERARMADPAPRLPAAEMRAEQTAVRGLAAPGLLGPAPAGRRSSGTTPSLAPRAGGRALPPAVRRGAEARLGVDLSDVRVHADAAGAARAEALGANAFAEGDDIVFARGTFAPGTPTGDRLLLHELAHVAQARTGAVPKQPQFDRPRPGGIGATPPRDPFMVGEGPGPEDGHVLFDRNRADLDPDDLATITALLRDRTQPLWIDIYGYASDEGEAVYNSNLSAHRGVAVRQVIERLMPAGSVVDVHAHGETGGFDTIEANRRVGIRLREAPPLMPGWRPRSPYGATLLSPGLRLTPPEDLLRDPAAADSTDPAAPAGPVTAPPIPFGPTFNPFPGPRLLPDPATPLAPYANPPADYANPALRVPPIGPYGLDTTTMARSAMLRGRMVDVRDHVAAEQFYWQYYLLYRPLGESLADTLANMTVTNAYDGRQALENPNYWDLMLQEEARLGISRRVLSIDLLNPPWAEKQKKNP